MIPLGRNTRQQGATGPLFGIAMPLLNEITFACVSGAVCQVIGFGLIEFPVSSRYVLKFTSGGTRSAAVPNGSESCQLSSHCTDVHCEQLLMSTWCSAQLIAPSPMLQPSPTQGAAPCTLCCSETETLL